MRRFRGRMRREARGTWIAMSSHMQNLARLIYSLSPEASRGIRSRWPIRKSLLVDLQDPIELRNACERTARDKGLSFEPVMTSPRLVRRTIFARTTHTFVYAGDGSVQLRSTYLPTLEVRALETVMLYAGVAVAALYLGFFFLHAMIAIAVAVVLAHKLRGHVFQKDVSRVANAIASTSRPVSPYRSASV